MEIFAELFAEQQFLPNKVFRFLRDIFSPDVESSQFTHSVSKIKKFRKNKIFSIPVTDKTPTVEINTTSKTERN